MTRSKIARRKASTMKSLLERPLVARGKLFANGRSQAVRLPKEFRFSGTEVLIRREGRRLILEPTDAKGWPVELWSQIDALAGGDNGWTRPPDPVPAPIRRERDLP